MRYCPLAPYQKKNRCVIYKPRALVNAAGKMPIVDWVTAEKRISQLVDAEEDVIRAYLFSMLQPQRAALCPAPCAAGSHVILIGVDEVRLSWLQRVGAAQLAHGDAG